MHCWPTAPPQYAYLRAPHRHMFHVKIEVVVGGLNRDVEFIQLKRDATASFVQLGTWTQNMGSSDALDYGAQSCEMLADALKATMDTYPSRYNITSIEVSEDGENGARLTWLEN